MLFVLGSILAIIAIPIVFIYCMFRSVPGFIICSVILIIMYFVHQDFTEWRRTKGYISSTDTVAVHIA